MHATPQPAVSVFRSVGLLVHQSVYQTVLFLLFRRWQVVLHYLLTKSTAQMLCLCPPARDLGRRVSGLVSITFGFPLFSLYLFVTSAWLFSRSPSQDSIVHRSHSAADIIWRHHTYSTADIIWRHHTYSTANIIWRYHTYSTADIIWRHHNYSTADIIWRHHTARQTLFGDITLTARPTLFEKTNED